MSQSAELSGGSPIAIPGQSLVVTMLSIAVVAATALLLQWITVPAEVTTSLAATSGALVPAIAIRRRERKKTKIDRAQELISGAFRRPPIYVLIIAAGMMAVSELFVYFVGGLVAGLALADANLLGLLTEGEMIRLQTEMVVVNLFLALIAFVTAVIVAVGAGYYVAHRIGRNALYWAVSAVALNQLLVLILDLISSASAGIEVNFWLYPLYVLLLSGAAWYGVYRGTQTRSLFLSTRLFRRLSESDRKAILELMNESQFVCKLAP